MIHIVLYEPEIPQNTGNIMRSCVAMGAKLHLIEPLGFVFDEKRVKRAVMDYYDYLDYVIHSDLLSFFDQVDGACYFLSRYGQQVYSDVSFNEVEGDIYLIFGSESKGIPMPILKENHQRTFRIPMAPHARSLNLSNTVALVGYEVLRQLEFPDLSKVEVQKGAHFIME